MSQILDEKINKMSESEQNLLKLRHTAEHVLHTAMQNLYPNLQKAMGPATDDGFYFDFDPAPDGAGQVYKVSEDDFPLIEKEMQKLINLNLKMVQEEISEQEAHRIFKDNPYKTEWVNLILERKEPLSIYKMMDSSGKVHDLDLCSGPHATSTGEVKAFKLLKIAGAYWHGDEKNKMLTRIYGIAFPTKIELENYTKQQEEIKKRDHRKIGKDLDLFSIDEEVGKGLILWHPKLAIVRHEVEKFWKEKHLQNDYKFVYTPNIGSMKIFTKTRHYSNYMNFMFPVMLHQFIEGESSQDYQEEEQLKPMNCPFHCAVYKSSPKSYKDLPLRFAELGTVYRYERSGQLHGMTRVRGFTQDDSHIFCRKSQAIDECVNVLKMIKEIYTIFGFSDFKAYLSTMPEKHLGLPEAWKFAEKSLEEAIKKCGLPYEIDEGEGAFYGPKIDIKVKDSIQREWQLATVQWDFNLPSRAESSDEEIKNFQNLKAFRYIFGDEHPGKKYDEAHKKQTDEKIANFLKKQGRGLGIYYTNENGEKEETIMIHRVILGSLERFFGVLIEHFGGAFPLWLSPVQVVLIPISEKQADYAKKVETELKNAGIRVENWSENESMQKRIKLAQEQKVPYMIILGERESNEGKISVRERSGKQVNLIDLHNFVNELLEKIRLKSLD